MGVGLTSHNINKPKVLQFLANNVLAPKAAAIEPMEEKVGEPADCWFGGNHK